MTTATATRPKAKRTTRRDPTSAYARAVVAGRIITGRLVRLACERHLDDLENGHERGLRWDVEKANRVIDFFPDMLCLAEGAFAGKPFKLAPFQQFIVGSLFGWLGPDGFRRFRTAYIETAKGSGKSPLCAGIGLYGLVADDEPAAEIYAAAVTRDQAKILFRDAELMVDASPELNALIDKRVNNLADLETNSYFRPVSSEKRGLDGHRVHMALIDEIHEHPSDVVVEKMRAGTKVRRQALIVEITNSGYDRKSICWQHHEMSERVLTGIIENDSWFAYVAQLDACDECLGKGHKMANPACPNCDDWRNEKVWIKANPIIDITPGRKYVREQVAEAIAMPSKQNVVLRLNFCIWTEQATRWLDMRKWGECGETLMEVVAHKLRGRLCYGGLDLASTTDLIALSLLFPPTSAEVSDAEARGEPLPPVQLICAFWVPAENMLARSRKDGVPYDLWERQGWITATEGNVADYDAVRRDINELSDLYNIRELGIDPWNATQLATQLEGDGVANEIVFVRQGWASMSGPSKELERLHLSRLLAHGDNPVLSWNASNVSIRQDPAGNIKPDKETSTERIDGIVSTVMSIFCWQRHDGSDGKSVYETRGVLSV